MAKTNGQKWKYKHKLTDTTILPLMPPAWNGFPMCALFISLFFSLSFLGMRRRVFRKEYCWKGQISFQIAHKLWTNHESVTLTRRCHLISRFFAVFIDFASYSFCMVTSFFQSSFEYFTFSHAHSCANWTRNKNYWRESQNNKKIVIETRMFYQNGNWSRSKIGFGFECFRGEFICTCICCGEAAVIFSLALNSISTFIWSVSFICVCARPLVWY